MLNAELINAIVILGAAAGFGGLMRAFIRHRTLLRLEREMPVRSASRGLRAAMAQPRLPKIATKTLTTTPTVDSPPTR